MSYSAVGFSQQSAAGIVGGAVREWENTARLTQGTVTRIVLAAS